MQIGSVSPDYAPSALAQQGALPPSPQSVPAQHKDKNGDHDGSTTSSIDSTTGKQVNVIA